MRRLLRVHRACPVRLARPELWRRFTISLRRLLERHLRAIGESAESVRLNYVKVTELQRRAVIRLDAPPVPSEPLTSPATSITSVDLAALVQQSAAGVTVSGSVRPKRFELPTF